MATAQKQLSGVFWENMIGLNSVHLSNRLDACAATDLHWSLDQARCLAHHTERDSRRFTAIGEFAAKKLPEIPNTDTDTRLIALELISGCLPPADTRSTEAAAEFRTELQRIFKNNPKSALDKAVLIGTSLLASAKLRETAANFIVRHTDPSEPTYLRHLCVSANRETLEKILVQIEALGKTDPLKAVAAIDIFLEYGRYNTGMQSLKADNMRRECEERGGFLARQGMLIVTPPTTENRIEAIAEKPRAQVLH